MYIYMMLLISRYTDVIIMNIIETKIEGLLILEPRVFGDDRGWFMESFNQKL